VLSFREAQRAKSERLWSKRPIKSIQSYPIITKWRKLMIVVSPRKQHSYSDMLSHFKAIKVEINRGGANSVSFQLDPRELQGKTER
jgi:hypothetical protein